MSEVLKARMKIQQAWLDGEKIEFAKRIYDCGFEYGLGDWRLVRTPCFEWYLNEYRVLRIKIVEFDDLEIGETYCSDVPKLKDVTWKIIEKGEAGEVWWEAGEIWRVHQETPIGLGRSTLNAQQVKNLKLYKTEVK